MATEASHGNGSSPVNLYISLYGQLAFGVATLLLIWFVIVKPELDSRAANYEAVQTVLKSLNDLEKSHGEIARTQAKTAETMATTASVLERTAARLEGLQ